MVESQAFTLGAETRSDIGQNANIRFHYHLDLTTYVCRLDVIDQQCRLSMDSETAKDEERRGRPVAPRPDPAQIEATFSHDGQGPDGESTRTRNR
ncbi:hypothetical protein SPHINGO391_390380 [Sphingomonas aurantiaca]|uniref:Uncharacterized protein n=1 Tax=Sphingomonas aurantiaca TaxID=185949 RepID=A0A5E7YU94_9SPHN|nr:hypothetical protein SPHINGO391_390380 [Sphingomonas aurantiaca]